MTDTNKHLSEKGKKKKGKKNIQNVRPDVDVCFE